MIVSDHVKTNNVKSKVAIRLPREEIAYFKPVAFCPMVFQSLHFKEDIII